MNIVDLIKTRRSVRNYQQKPVPKALFQQVLEAGIWAPSSRNQQPWRFIAMSHPDKRNELAREAKIQLAEFLETQEAASKYGAPAVERFKKRATGEGDTLLYNAPVILFVIQTKPVDSDLDYGLCLENMMLCAHGIGLGTCPIGLAIPLNNSKTAREILKLKTPEKIVLALSLGFPDEAPSPTERRLDVIQWVE
ncbi:nitroreductase [Candidatus Peregrinibacteria bacterium]|nr:nitroreductase [Candidatus Peregrinibacteria bacterium]